MAATATAEHEALVHNYSHLRDFPRQAEALHALKRIASLVKPIMRARSWKVGELAEFYPDQTNLLGINVNRGQQICLRLRYPGDRSQFFPIEEVVDTMLHELSHNVHGPHNAKFHALWNQLRDEHEGLIRKGYTGEGFLSEGRRLGGGRIPRHEARRLARAAAEERRVVQAQSGQRLGGTGPAGGQNIRSVIVSAIERRNNTLQGCGNTKHTDREIQEISETATRNGFRTQAEEDAANEAAIAQALWELVQEEEQQKYGGSYIPPSAANPTGNGGGAVMDAQDGASERSAARTNRRSRETHTPAARAAASASKGWTCSICTLYNPIEYLCCDACGVEKAEDVVAISAQPISPADPPGRPQAKKSTRRPVGSQAAEGSQAPDPPRPSTWVCSLCGNTMDRQWWTCSTCGKMKDNSW